MANEMMHAPKGAGAKADFADYAPFLAAVKERVRHARTSAAQAVNRGLILLYWDIGRAIVAKQAESGWGDAVVERLAADLRGAFPDMSGFSGRNLRDMKRMWLAYSGTDFWRQAVAKSPGASSGPEIWRQAVAKLRTVGEREDFLQQLVEEVPWGQHLLILNKQALPKARLYYLRATAHFGWSRNVLLNQIKAGAYERAVKEKKTHNFAWALPEHFAEQAGEMMKSRYNLEFLGIGKAVKERELEDRLIDRLQQFILELGYGFCFVGRQYRLALGRKEYFVDPLFYLKRAGAPIGVKPALRCGMELSE